MMRAVAYVRSSTDKQEASIEQQLKAIHDYCAENHIQLVRKFFGDEAVSGTSSDRPGFLKLMVACSLKRQENDYNAVIIYDRSRWGRWLDHKDAIYYEQFLKHHGIKLIAVKGNGSDDIGGDITRMIESHGASDFSRKLSEVVRRGSRHNAERGNWNGGKAPYGYARMEYDPATGEDTGVLEPGRQKGSKTNRVRLVLGPSHEVFNVKRIFNLRLKQGYTLQQIANVMLAPDDGPWTKQRISRLLNNPVYKGEMTWKDGGGKYGEGGDLTTKRNAHEAIITEG